MTAQLAKRGTVQALLREFEALGIVLESDDDPDPEAVKMARWRLDDLGPTASTEDVERALHSLPPGHPERMFLAGFVGARRCLRGSWSRNRDFSRGWWAGLCGWWQER